MARLNIEDSLWKETAFQDLMIRVGNRHMAKGMVIELFALAQEFWFPDRKLISKDRIVSAGLSDTIVAGLAEEREGGVYVRGSEAAFDWLFQKQSAGMKSAESKKKQRKSTGVDGRRRTSTSSSSSSSFSSSFSSSDSLISKGEVADAPAPTIVGIKNPVGLFISNYVKAYQTRYPGARPDLTGKVQGRIRTYVEETPIERACEMIRTYCEMNDAWFITKAHDFETFIQNLSKVGVQLDTGRSITSQEARKTETKQTIANVFSKVLEKAK